MAINIYDSFTNHRAGETFKGISFNDEAFVMEWTMRPEGYVLLEHVHLYQDEKFYVRSGNLKVVIDGVAHTANAGETITVPKGKRHVAYNNGNEILNCVIEYRPGLDHYKFFQCFAGLIQDDYLDKRGGIDVPKMGYFLFRMNAKCMARPTKIPAPAYRLALRFFYLLGTLKGWGKLYKKYTE